MVGKLVLIRRVFNFIDVLLGTPFWFWYKYRYFRRLGYSRRQAVDKALWHMELVL